MVERCYRLWRAEGLLEIESVATGLAEVKQDYSFARQEQLVVLCKLEYVVGRTSVSRIVVHVEQEGGSLHWRSR